jgi:hypothetical protein
MRTTAGAANSTATATRSRTTKTKAKTITVRNSPACEYHLERAGEYVSAHVVGVTSFGTHEFMCTTCFNFYGMGLGLGKGQILVMGA